MKTKFIFSMLICLFTTVGVFAKKPETNTLSNIQNTAEGSIKEFTTFWAETNEPVQKTTYKYNLDGNILEKAVYDWKGSKGWIGKQKLEYTYETSNADKPSSLVYRKWDDKTSNWSEKSKEVTYNFDSNDSTSN